MTSRRSRFTGEDGERGAFIVLFAVSLTMIMVMIATVVDLGFLRSSVRIDQNVADTAALAAGADLSAGAYLNACTSAVSYLDSNIPGFASINPTSFCTQAGNDVTKTMCSPPYTATQAAPTATVGKWTVSLHFPVPASEISDPVYGAGVNDGNACERMRIVVSSTEPTFFGRIVGQSSYSATRSATIRSSPGRSTVTPALWLLDPTGCVGLTVSGGSQLTVGTSTPTVNPGVISIDSDGSTCAGQQATISSSGSGTLLQAVPLTGGQRGAIRVRALSSGAVSCLIPACDPSDVAAGRLNPQPIGTGRRATRAPVDWRYNCKSTYPTYHSIAIAGCPSGVPPYLDLLRTQITNSGSPGPSYQQWSAAGQSCNPAGTVTVTGNWWIDCPGGLSIGNGTTVTFAGGNVVADAGISMTGGALNVNTANPTSTLPSSCIPPTVTTPCVDQSSAGAAFLYVRSGDLNFTGGAFTANKSMTYLATGVIKVAGGAPPTWVAPVEGPFDALALWAEASSNKFQVNGGAGAVLSGTFFTPEAKPFSLGGGGTWGQQSAQFISYQLAVSGGGSLTLSPNPLDAIRLPALGGTLIR